MAERLESQDDLFYIVLHPLSRLIGRKKVLTMVTVGPESQSLSSSSIRWLLKKGSPIGGYSQPSKSPLLKTLYLLGLLAYYAIVFVKINS